MSGPVDWDGKSEVGNLTSQIEMHQRIVDGFQSLQHRTAMVLAAGIATACGVFAASDKDVGQWFGVAAAALSQLIAFLGLLVALLQANIAINEGYIHALEERINRLVGGPLVVWESRMNARFYSRVLPPTAMTLSTAWLVLIPAVVVAILLYVSRESVQPMLLSGLAAVDIAVLVPVLILLLFQRGRARKYAMEKLGESETGKS